MKRIWNHFKKAHPKILSLILIIAMIGILIPLTKFIPIQQPEVVYADTTGPQVPTAEAPVTSGAGDNNGFETGTVTDVSSVNSVYMVSTNSGTAASTNCALPNTTSDQNDFYNFGLNVPNGANVDGITVTVGGKYDSNTGTNTFCVFLSNDGGTTWTAGQNTIDYGTGYTQGNLGGSTDDWGHTWTSSELSDSNFRVRVMPLVGNTARDASLDYLAVDVAYTIPPPTLSSASNQSFTIGQSSTGISTITATDNAGGIITAANDIRIAIATSTFNYLWDTSDTSATIGGTAAGKVSSTVSYEGGGSVLVLDVTSDFVAGDTITISGLSYKNFGSPAVGATTGALNLYVGGAADTTAVASDTATVTIVGTVALSNHTLGQVVDKFQNNETSTTSEFYQFQLTNTGESASTTLRFDLSSIIGITSSDITDPKVYMDINNDGHISTATSSQVINIASAVNGFVKDATNNVMYAATGAGVYRCLLSTNCDEDTDWLLTIATTSNTITIDTTNQVLYSNGSKSIIRCPISTNCDESGDWSVVYTAAQAFNNHTMDIDTAHQVIYAGDSSSGFAKIYRCDLSTGCDQSIDWTSYAPTSLAVQSLLITNNRIYTGNSFGSTIRICVLSTNCDEVSDWSTSFTIGSAVYSLAVDSKNQTMYAGTSNSGIVYQCNISTNCDALSDWSVLYDSGTTIIYTVGADTLHGIIYAAGSLADGYYSCNTSTDCTNGSNWATTTYSGSAALLKAFYFDPTTGVSYLGDAETRMVRIENGDAEVFASTSASTAPIVNISGGSGSILFPATTTLPLGTYNYILTATTSNITTGDQITFGLPSTNLISYGNYSNSLLDVSGSISNITHSWPSLATIASASNQSFNIGQSSTGISTITITDLAGVITAANDIRIPIATSTFGFLWDTSDTSATIGGTAASKVSSTVSYEGGGSVLVLDVNSDFSINDTLTISGLAFTSFTAPATSGIGALQLYLGGATDIVADATDTSTITIAKGLTLSNHTLNQVVNKFQNNETSTSTSFFQFKLNPLLAASTTLTFDLSSITGITSSDITDPKVYLDANGDGQISPSQNWASTTRFVSGGNGLIMDLETDTYNNVLYMGIGNSGGIYRCPISSGCNEESDWTKVYSALSGVIRKLVYDSTHHVMYAGDGGTGNIYRCDTSTNCDQDADWTVSYSSPESEIESMTFDSTHGVLYVGGGTIYRCDTSTNCDQDADWTTSYSPVTLLRTMVFDSGNGVIYAGSSNSGIVYRCDTSTSCDQDTDWTSSLDASANSVWSLTYDSIHGVLYAGSDTSGKIYRCPTSSGCDANADWTQVTGIDGTIYSLTFNQASGNLYAGTDPSGYIYTCDTSTGCDSGSEWTLSIDTTDSSVWVLESDSSNSTIYAGTWNSGAIFQKIEGDTEVFASTSAATAPVVSISGASGTIWFPATTTLPIGTYNYILTATTSNIAAGDKMTISLSPSNIISYGTVSGTLLTVSGSVTSIIHTAGNVVAGVLSVLAHTLGQIPNPLQGVSSLTDAVLYAFKLTPTNEDISISKLIFSIYSSKGISANDITNAELVVDANSNKAIDGGESTVGGAGTVSIQNGVGTITFNSTFTSSVTSDYLLKLSIANIANYDEILLGLKSTSFTATGATSGSTIIPIVTVAPVLHYRSDASHGYSGGSTPVGGDAPAGQGTQSGGTSGAGTTTGGSAPTGQGTQGGGTKGGGGEAMAPHSSMLASTIAAWDIFWNRIWHGIKGLFT